MKNSPKDRKYGIGSNVKIVRNVSGGSHNFREIFQGFDDLGAIRSIFGQTASAELDKLKIEVFPREGYMGVSDEDGHIFASQQYLNQGEEWSVYLDIIHELVHVKQFQKGMNLFDPRYAYVDRPTEIEAYRVSVEEGRKIGMSEQELFAYLEVPWISKQEHERLARACGIVFEKDGKSKRKKE